MWCGDRGPLPVIRDGKWFCGNSHAEKYAQHASDFGSERRHGDRRHLLRADFGVERRQVERRAS